MTGEDILEHVAEANEEAMFADDFEGALIGYVELFGHAPLALYDRDKCLDILMRRDEMSYDEAFEFFEYNVIGAYVGENTPAFATILTDEVE